MAISLLPKELRLQIWANVYLNEPPRLVALETKPHDEGHDEQHFCPRYCPSPAPIAVNLCQESRTEALYQATKANHIVHLPAGQAGTSCDDFYFRMDTDILLLQLHGPRVKHYDDSPEVGLLAHFLLATGCHPTKLSQVLPNQKCCGRLLAPFWPNSNGCKFLEVEQISFKRTLQPSPVLRPYLRTAVSESSILGAAG